MNITVLLVAIFLFTTLVLCGCLEEKDTPSKSTPDEESTDNTNNTINMDAQGLIEDFKYSINFKSGSTKWIWGYESLKDGDTLILTDTISNITYTESMLFNATNISFNVDGNKNKDFDKSSLNLLFQGNLTNEFKVGDKVKITVTIEKFTYGNQTSSMYYQTEVFEEGWNVDNFLSNQTGFSFTSMFGSFLQVLPAECIEKI